jgi:hypothetical protein
MEGLKKARIVRAPTQSLIDFNVRAIDKDPFFHSQHKVTALHKVRNYFRLISLSVYHKSTEKVSNENLYEPVCYGIYTFM